MKIVCAWCSTVIAEGEDPVSHGICSRCFAKQVEHRPITDEEYSACLHRSCDVLDAEWTIWYLDAVTVVLHATAVGWAFDCRMDLDMVKTHYQEVFT